MSPGHIWNSKRSYASYVVDPSYVVKVTRPEDFDGANFGRGKNLVQDKTLCAPTRTEVQLVAVLTTSESCYQWLWLRVTFSSDTNYEDWLSSEYSS